MWVMRSINLRLSHQVAFRCGRVGNSTRCQAVWFIHKSWQPRLKEHSKFEPDRDSAGSRCQLPLASIAVAAAFPGQACAATTARVEFLQRQRSLTRRRSAACNNCSPDRPQPGRQACRCAQARAGAGQARLQWCATQRNWHCRWERLCFGHRKQRGGGYKLAVGTNNWWAHPTRARCSDSGLRGSGDTILELGALTVV
eukprot:352204-Chlamydomonas_euryale.AAC.4